ncbi:MAG: phage holin family protein [Anaerolineae bacterium]
MSRLSSVVSAVVRFLVIWLVDGVALFVTATVLPSIALHGDTFSERFLLALAAAFLLGLVNLLLRPLVLLLARPLGFIALFVIGFFANALALLATSWLMAGFEVSSFVWAIVGGVVFAAINAVLTGVLEVDAEGSYYQSRIERRAREQVFDSADEPGRGLVMLEIDGLSYHHLHKAIEEGRLPTVKRLIDEDGYVVSPVDCGLPSQTSACQAGILFGDNHDIPAFRWYDKAEGRLYVSGNDAGDINARYAKGGGLLRGGSSIDNMLDGDAEKSLLTVSNVFSPGPGEAQRRADDVFLLMLDPYFLMRTVGLFFADVGRELRQYWAQVRRDEQPRLNRLAHGYPFIRAATTTFVRDISRHLAALDIIRGAPAIYVTWPGYDEVAHHSGPWSEDAFGVLATYDQVIAGLLSVIREKAPRHYDLIVLSDHGQSYGPTFKQRYGLSLKELIEGLLPQGTTITESLGGDTGAPSIKAVSGELGNMADYGAGNALARSIARQGQALVEHASDRLRHASGSTDEDQQAQVTAYGSGNLAQVYFDLYPRKITLTELSEAYPGMVDALVAHEGIGLVCGYEDDGTPVALGKGGKRDLHSGEVVGDDPLVQYAPDEPGAPGHSTLETRAWQVRRVMDFPSAGDLMVISTVYPDGTVAALEELIGSHGGMGGEQTDSFLFHPGDMEVGPTRNSVDVFHILNRRRGSPVTALPAVTAAAKEAAAREAGLDPWSREAVVGGLRDVRRWVELAARALVLDRGAYHEIASDPRLSAPGLMLGLGFTLLAEVVRTLSATGGVAGAMSGAVVGGWLSTLLSATGLIGILGAWLGWLIAVFFTYGAGKVLTRNGNYTRTMRAMGFAQVTSLFAVVSLLPVVGPLGQLIRVVVSFFAWWMAAAEAHDTRGWRTIALPVLSVAALLLVPLLIGVLFGSAALGVQSVLEQFGLAAPQ